MVKDDLIIRPGLDIPESELIEQASRSSGPGGQHVNKSSTRVTLRWNVRESRVGSAADRTRLEKRLAGRLNQDGELIVHADRSRSRTRNREAARERLAELVSAALVREPKRVATRPTKASKRRRLGKKKRQSDIKTTRRRPSHDD